MCIRDSHYTWFKNGPDDVKSVATWGSTAGADNQTNSYAIDTSFPKGVSFGKWLQNVNASADGANIDLKAVAKSVSDTNAKSLNWISKPNDTYKVKYMSFNTPVAKPVAPAKKSAAAPAKKTASTSIVSAVKTLVKKVVVGAANKTVAKVAAKKPATRKS